MQKQRRERKKQLADFHIFSLKKYCAMTDMQEWVLKGRLAKYLIGGVVCAWVLESQLKTLLLFMITYSLVCLSVSCKLDSYS